MIDSDLVLTASHAPLLLWLGFLILSKRRPKWYTFLLLLGITLIFNYTLYAFISVYVRPVTFFFILFLSTFVDNHWKRNFYFLALAAITFILTSSLARFFAHLIDPELPIVYIVLIKIALMLVFLLVLNRILTKIRVLDMTTVEAFYQNFIVIIIAGILACYYVAHLLPFFLGINCLYTARLQLVYVVILALPIGICFFTVNAVVNKEIKIISINQCLKAANVDLERSQSELKTTIAHIGQHYELIFKLSRSIEDKEALLQEKKEYIDHLDKQFLELAAYQEKARKFEHDIRYMFSVLNDARVAGEWEAFDEFCEQFKTEAISVIDSLPNLPVVNHLRGHKLFPVRQILLAMAQKASTLSIRFSVEIPEDINHVGIPTLDLVRILTNWLSNAFEEAIHTEDKRVHVSFIVTIESDDAQVLFLRVTNDCRQNLPFAISDLRLEGVSSKGESRGYGLSIVEDIANKHEHIFVSTEQFKEQNQDRFIQVLEVVLD